MFASYQPTALSFVTVAEIFANMPALKLYLINQVYRSPLLDSLLFRSAVFDRVPLKRHPRLAVSRFREIFEMKPTLSLVLAILCAPAVAADCGNRPAVETINDVPGAISYDIYSQLHPITPQKLAIFTDSEQIKLLPKDTQACEIRDDGVEDPSAVLLRVPGKSLNFWVPRQDIQQAG